MKNSFPHPILKRSRRRTIGLSVVVIIIVVIVIILLIESHKRNNHVTILPEYSSFTPSNHISDDNKNDIISSPLIQNPINNDNVNEATQLNVQLLQTKKSSDYTSKPSFLFETYAANVNDDDGNKRLSTESIHIFDFEYLWYYPNKKELHFCLSVGSGMGNLLTQYWAARAIAFWRGLTFIIPDNQPQGCIAVKQQTKLFEKNSMFTYYLPHNVNANYTEYSDILSSDLLSLDLTNGISSIIETILRIQSWMDRAMIRGHKYCRNWVHECKLLLTFYNPYYSKIVQIDTWNAIKKYYNDPIHTHELNTLITNNNGKNIIKSPMLQYNDPLSDIVIHIRCGDVLHNNGPEYGFMTYKYYEYAINKSTTNWKNKINSNTKIWILSQLSKSSARDDQHEEKQINSCTTIVEGLVNKKLSKLFEPGIIEIIRDGSIQSDYIKMIYAPLLICGMSTFCLNAALAHQINNNNDQSYVVLPMLGPWISFGVVAKQDKNYDGKTFKNNRILPKNHIFVETRTSKMYVAGEVIVQNKWEHKPDEFVEYLINN